MPGPWEQYQAAPAEDARPPWEQYAATKAPTPLRTGAAAIPVGGTAEAPVYADQMPKTAPQPESGFLNWVRGGVEAALNTVAGVVGGGAGLAYGATEALGKNVGSMLGGGQPSTDVEQNALARARQFTPELPQALQTPTGQRYTQNVGEALATHGPSVIGIGPELGALGQAMGPVARAMAGARGREMAGQVLEAVAPGVTSTGRQAAAAAAETKAAALARPELEGIRAAHEAGYKLTPKAAQAGLGARIAESAAGPARLGKELSAHNAENTARLARQDVGLPDDVPATPEATAQIRKEAGQDYAAVQDVGRFENDKQYVNDLNAIVKPYLEGGKDYAQLAKNPIIDKIEGLRIEGADTGSAISVVKDLRNEADKAFRVGDKNLGGSYRAAAAAVDNSMDRALGRMSSEGGDPALANAVDKYRAARVRIAKTYLLDDAMTGKPGEVNAKVYARALDKGSRLSGPGLQIAQFGKQFGEEGLAQSKGKAGGAGPGYGDILLAALHTPLGAAAMIARPVARAALGSEFMQKRMAGGKPLARPPTAPEGMPPAGGPGPEGMPPALTDPRLASIEQARSASTSDAVRAALAEHEKTVRKTIATEQATKQQAADVDALEAAAKATQDTDLRATLQAKADKLRTEKIPVGEAKELATTPTAVAEKPGKIPVGKVIEGQPELLTAKPEPIPAGEATEIAPEMIEPTEPIPAGETSPLPSNLPAGEVVSNRPLAEPVSNRPAGEMEPVSNVPQAEANAYAHRALFDEATKRGIEVRGRRPSEVRTAFEADWRHEHKLGTDDAARAKNVAAALDIDEAAVTKAATQFEKSPRAFDRAVQTIIDQGGENAPETKQAVSGSESVASNPPGSAGSQAGPGAGRGGNANDSAGGASGSQSNPNTGGAVGSVEAAAEQSGANGPSASGANAEAGIARGQAPAGEGASEPRIVKDKRGAEYAVTVKQEAFGAAKNAKSVLVEARDPKTGDRRGFVDFEVRSDGVLIAGNVKVAPEFRERGIAELMYKAARDAGHDIAPGGVQTDLGNAMVERLQAKGLINKAAEGKRFRAGDLDIVPIEGEKIPGENAVRPEPKGFEKGAQKATLPGFEPGDTLESFGPRGLKGNAWVLRNKATGEAVLETRDPAKVRALNTAKYEAIPVGKYLAEINRKG